MKTLIEKKDFTGFVRLSSNLKYDDGLQQKVYSAQLGFLQPILTQHLYDVLIGKYSIIHSVVSTNQNGLSTDIELSSVADIDVNDYFTFEGLPDIVDSIGEVLNGNEFQVKAINSNTITIDFDTTGKNNTTSGSVINWLTPDLRNLRTQLLPYLVFQSYTNYIPTSTIRDTPTGARSKKSDYGQQLIREKTTEQNTVQILTQTNQTEAETHKAILVSFLEANSEVYEWNVNESCDPTQSVYLVKPTRRF